MTKASEKKFTVDFDAVLMAPNGKPMTEPKFDNTGKVVGEEDVTVGGLCYLVCTRNLEDDTMTAQQAVKYFRLAHVASTGGTAELTVSERSLLLARVDKFPMSLMAKAALLLVIDPAEYEKATRT